MIQLNWVPAVSCTSGTLPPSQPPFASATITQQGDGSITATWPYDNAGRAGVLYTRFVNENNVWRLCSWDIADV